MNYLANVVMSVGIRYDTFGVVSSEYVSSE